MKITKRADSKKTVIFILAVLLVAMVSGSVFALNQMGVIDLGFSKQAEDKPENTVNYDEPTDEQKKEGERIKDEFDKKHYDDKDKAPNEPKGDGSITVNITNISQEATTVSVRSMIQSLVPGSCKLSVSQNGSIVYESEAETMMQGSYSVCKGFDVDSSNFNPGNVSFKISYNNSSATGYAQKDFLIK